MNLKESDVKDYRNIVSNILAKLKGNKRIQIIFILAAFGIILLVISKFGGESEKPETKTETDSSVKEDVYTYAEDIEKRLSDIVGAIEGAGKTKVMITLESGAEQVYAKENKIENNSSKDIKPDEAAEDENISSEEEYIVIKTDSDNDSGLLIKIIQPQIRGVAIVCEGSGIPQVEQSIIDTVSSVLGISSAKISIAQMAK